MIWMNIVNFPMNKLKYKKLFKVTRQWPWLSSPESLSNAVPTAHCGQDQQASRFLLPNVEVIYKKTITSAFHRAMFRYPCVRPPQCELLLLGFRRDPMGVGGYSYTTSSGYLVFGPLPALPHLSSPWMLQQSREAGGASITPPFLQTGKPPSRTCLIQQDTLRIKRCWKLTNPFAETASLWKSNQTGLKSHLVSLLAKWS